MHIKPIMYDFPEVIETKRLLLQMPKAGYGESLHEAILDGYEDYIKWLDWPASPPSVDMVEENCRKHHSDFILRDVIRYIIIEKATNRIVGRCAYPPLQLVWEIPQFGIAFFIRKTARNQGYATETAHALALFAFRELKALKLEIFCDSDNEPSQKIPLKLGFKHECTKKGVWSRPDKPLINLQTYALFEESGLPKGEVKW